ncbi:MAG: hypothetical protein JXA99_09695 [Candidatus Lokiarchaeota archaeon]|nr:hypothetical protein [Candidatus Lokiarchaeota archaeon]
MNILSNQYNSDLDYYYDILEQYQQISKTEKDKDIWKYRLYMQLMELLIDKNNITLVRNSILLILSLFENLPPDPYNNQGININSITEAEKKILISNLKEEIA